MARKKQKPQILLVEGNDDKHVMWNLCEKFSIPENFDVIDCKGIEKLFARIPVELKGSNIKTIGIIIDADLNIKSRWQQLMDILQKTEYHTEDITINQNGTIILQEDKPKIGIWIMPNNELNGMLEDFIKFLIPENDQLLPITKNVLNDIETKKLNQYKQIHHSKALIHTWLAWQEDSGTPMGLAITKRYLTTEKETCNIFIEWLKELFVLN